MNKLRIPSRRVLPLLVLGALLTACNSTPERKAPPPKPVSVNRTELPAPPPLSPPPIQHKAEPIEAPADVPQNAALNDDLPPGSDAADVEITEVPIDDTPVMTEITDTEPSPAPPDDAPSKTSATMNTPPEEPPVMIELTDEENHDITAPTLNAPPAPTDASLVGPEINRGAKTSSEQVAILDAELNSQLNDFEKRMQRAREAADNHREGLATANAGAPEGRLEGRGYRRHNPSEAASNGGAAAHGSGIGGSPELSGEQRQARTQVARHGPPPGLGDGGDDDIVARQLREAASQEPDPVLRDKLWAEYRKYKAGL